MILITGGYPQSGKSEFSRRLKKTIPKWMIHIDPKTWLPDNFDTMDDLTRSVWMTSAWEYGYEKTTEFLQRAPNKACIIFDTAAAKFVVMKPLLDFAKKKKHDLIYVFVDADLEERKTRTDDPNLLNKLEASYTVDFKHTVPAIKKMSDKFLLVKNSGETGYQEMDNAIESLCQYIKSVRD